MKLVEMKIVASVNAADIGKERPFPNDEALETVCDEVKDALELGLGAVINNVKVKFPHVHFQFIA